MVHFDMQHIAEQQKAFFFGGASKSISFRRERLRCLRDVLTTYHDRILQALREDLGKPAMEAYGGEVSFVLHELDYALKNLKKWTRPRRVPTPLLLFPGASVIVPEPYGSVLIISPWNYPFQLSLGPLVGAIAAGNCAVIKPSELAPHSSALLAEMLDAHFDPDSIAVCEGGVKETQILLAQHFDYIFFTGGTRIGRIIMEAAARHVTPVTLELGGKNPCIVDRDANLDIAARRIVWGKCFNAGQSCVAPDYVVAHTTIKAELLTRMKTVITRFYGENPAVSPDYGRIINDAHFTRLAGLLQDGKVVAGGHADAGQRYIAPTILDHITWDHAVMHDEIFGPLLPVLEYDDLDALLSRLQSQPKPLALYVFSNNSEYQKRIVSTVPSGGVSINDTIDHMLNAHLPFGGLGASGMGAYHGTTSFETFSHRRSILKRAVWLDPQLKYPPYTIPLRYLAKALKFLS